MLVFEKQWQIKFQADTMFSEILPNIHIKFQKSKILRLRDLLLFFVWGNDNPPEGGAALNFTYFAFEHHGSCLVYYNFITLSLTDNATFPTYNSFYHVFCHECRDILKEILSVLKMWTVLHCVKMS